MAKSTTTTKKETVAKKSKPAAKHAVVGGTIKLKPAEQKVIDLVAALKVKLGKNEAPRKQIFAMAGMGKSTFANALTTIKNAGLMIVSPNALEVTEEGMKHADPDSLKGEIAMSNKEHIEKTKEFHKLKPKACELVDELADGQVKNTKEVCEKIGMKMNSTFANLKTDLKKKNIIVFDRTTIQLHDDMFPFGKDN